MMLRSRGCTALACLAVALAGCGWAVTPPRRPDALPRPRRVADRVILRVRDGTDWGGGRLGEMVRDTLIAAGSFGEVDYPVEPRNPPRLTLVVDATGAVKEEYVLGTVKSVVTGLLFLLPSGVIRYHKTFDLDAAVVLRDGDRELQRFTVETSTGVSHTLFTGGDEYEPEARTVAFRDLGERIAATLRPVDGGSASRDTYRSSSS